MWPFSKQQTSEIPRQLIEDSLDDLGLVRLNNLNDAISNALQKHLDPSQLYDSYSDDQSGYFQSEFNLVATASRMKGLYRREPWVYTCASLIARTLANVPFDVIDNETNEVDDDHPLNKIINSGNRLQDNLQLNWSGDLDLVLGGNEFLILDEGDNLVHVPVEYVELKFAENNKDKNTLPIEGITIRQSAGGFSSASMNQTVFVPWQNVIHFKMPNPFSPYIGMSMIAAASRPILLDRHKNEFEMAFYLRGGTNSGVIETTEDITKSRMERLMRTFENAFTGRRNWFRQLFLPKGARWVNSGLTMAEMEHLEGLRENRLTLLAVLGIPPMKVGISQDVNRATSEIQDKTFYENTIIPLAKMKASGWNNSYIIKNIFKGAVRVEPNFDGIEAVEGGILSRAEQAKALDNIATINEQREIAKLPPLKPTDPRGKLFLVELENLMMFDPYAGEGTPTDQNEIGPDDGSDDIYTEVHIEETTDGKHVHTHEAEINENGDGITISTSSGDEHTHKIVNGQVRQGGVESHTHPDLILNEDVEEKNFIRIKQMATSLQESIEESQGTLFYKALQRNLTIKIEQVKIGLNAGISDMKTYLKAGLELRVEQYKSDAVEILKQTMDKGFTLAQTQTRSFSNYSVKAINFEPEDEMAIEAIRQRTKEGKRKTLADRGIESYLGFDETGTEKIQKVIEEGLADGKTTESIAKTIEKDFGENYRDQAFTIARTETLVAISEGLKWQNDVLNEVFTEVNKQWFHVGDVKSNPDARDEHFDFEKAGNKGIVPSDHVWVNPKTKGELRYPRDPQAGGADVINCRCSMSSVIPKTARSRAGQIT